MSVSTTLQPTLAAALWPRPAGASAVRPVALAVLGSLFVALSAQVQVPLEPVPITMQTFAVLVLGMAYGWRLGAATLALYTAEGGIGLPVFAGLTGGPAVLFGPTGGYIFGFVATAAAVGWLAERGWDRDVVRTALAMLVGNALIYVPGLAVLSGYVGGFDQAVKLGLAPFLLGDALKLALAAGLLPLAWRLVGRGRGA